MNGGKDCEGGDREGQPPLAQVPIGWQRRADRTGVVYISPSGSLLSCLDQVKSYLLTDGTCKCGLECPLILPKVFNFDPGAAVKQRTAEDVKADEDVTKLCIHKRKIIAVATLNRSMESPHPSLVLTSPGGGTSATPLVPTRSVTPRAIRNKSHEGQPNSTAPDCKNPFRMIMAGQRHYQPEQEMFAGHARVRLGSGEQGQRSPYRGGMLSPASYGDGSISPRTDPLGSPDVFARGMSGGFHGTGSPSPLNGNVRTALSSPPGLSHQGSPAAQSSCALAGRTNVPLSPTVAAKSPIMKKPACSGFPPSIELLRGIYHHQPPPPSCALQKQQITSEKDPLGILDPIPSKPGGQNPVTALNPSFQPSVHSQVPAMNVNMPPAIVPLPSNLPLPTVKPGHASHSNHAGHTQRVQHMASTSVSPSPVTSPVHMMGPAMGRLEASPQRSRPSSTSSDHGNFSMLPTPQSSCGGVKVTPRSPRPSMPPSPSTKPDGLHQYKDMLSQLPSGMNSTLSGPGGAMFPPQKNHTGMLGLPLNHILNQHNSSSFPASSLLSAAAKAQLASQGKLTGSGNSGGGVGGGGGSGGGVGVGGSSRACGNSVHPSSVGNQEGHGVSNTGFSPNPSMPLGMSEVQSGRAALRDKLMAQQRDLLRKRKQPDRGGHDDVGFNMLKSPMGGARLPGPAEQMRKAHVRPGGLPPNTSMAQLLQSMSYQSSQSAGNSAPICQGTNQSLGTSNQLHFREGAMPPGPPHHNMQALQRLPARGEDLHCQNMDTGLTLRGSHEQFTGLMDQVRAASVGACGAPGQGGQVALGNCSLGRREPHPQQVIHRHHHPPQGHPRALGPVAAATMVPNANGGSCPQNVSKKGDGLNCSLRNPQLANLRALAGNKQTFPQRPPQAVQVRQGVPGFQTPHPFPHNSSSSPMACLFHNFQVSLPESVSVSNTQTCARSGTTPLPETSGRKSLPQFGEGPHKAQAQSVGPAGAEGLPGGCVGGESVDAIYRAVVDAASKGVQVVITTTVSGTTQARPVPSLSSMSAFTASQGGPCGLPQSVSSVIHGHRKPRLQEADARPIQPRMSCPRQSSEQGKSTHDSGKARGYFRSPGAQKRQWEGDATPGADCYPLSWRGEEFLECSAHVRSSPCKEGLRGLASSLPRPSEHQHNPLLPGDKVFLEDGFRFGNCQRVAGGGIKERLEQVAERCAHMNGGGPLLPGRGYVDTLGPPRHDLMSEDQSPSSSSTSLEGSLSKDYAHYNGHYNGCAPSPSDTKSLSSEEDLRHPDSPSSSELLHFRPRAFPMGELVWGPIKRFSPWHSKMAGEEQVHHPSLQNSEHGKVDPGRLKTLTEDLEAFNRAAKRNIKGGNLNNHLEAAIHVTMSELDKMSGNVHQVPPRDRQVKPPKSKRRKISR